MIDEYTARQRLAELKARLAQSGVQDDRYAAVQVRDHAALLFERIFGDAVHPLVAEMMRVPIPRRSANPFSVLLRSDSVAWDGFRHDVDRLLDNAAYRLDLDQAPMLAHLEAAQPSADAIEHLRSQFAQLVPDIEGSDLPAGERGDLRAVVEEALTILDRVTDPATARQGFERLVGRSVSRAARSGPAQSFWGRVAATVILADAAFGIGANLHELTASPQPVAIEVQCNVGIPALLPGDPVSPDPDVESPEKPKPIPDSERRTEVELGEPTQGVEDGKPQD